MAHTQDVKGTNGDWTFTLPDNVFIRQGFSTSNLELTPSTVEPLVFEIHYDKSAFRDTHGMISITVKEPANNADSGDGGLRGPVKFEFHNDLQATINEGPYGSLAFLVLGNQEDLSATTVFHTTYAHMHGVASSLFGGHTVSPEVYFGTGNVQAPNGFSLHGAIPANTVESWGAVTLHQRQQPNADDNFSITLYPPQGAVSEADSAKILANPTSATYYYTLQSDTPGVFWKGWLVDDNNLYTKGQTVAGPRGTYTIDEKQDLGYEPGDQQAVWKDGRIYITEYHSLSGKVYAQAEFLSVQNAVPNDSTGYGGLGSEDHAINTGAGWQYVGLGGSLIA